MILNFVDFGKYFPECLNVSINEFSHGTNCPFDAHLTIEQFFMLSFPDGVVEASRLGRGIEHLTPGEALAFVTKLRSFRSAEGNSLLLIDGYGTTERYHPIIRLMADVCGLEPALPKVKDENFAPEMALRCLIKESDLGRDISTRIDFFLQKIGFDGEPYQKNKDRFLSLIFLSQCSQLNKLKNDTTSFFRSVKPSQHSSPVVIVKLVGGLGDQFYRYATARMVAVCNGAELLWDDMTLRVFEYGGRSCILPLFNTSGTFVSKQYYTSLIAAQISSIEAARITHPPVVLSPIIEGCEESPDCNLRAYRVLYLNNSSCWPSFRPIMPLLRQELTLKKPASGANLEMEELIKTCADSVSVHVRLTDFVSLGLELPFTYYSASMALLEESVSQPQYFIFSDEIEKVKQILQPTPNITYVTQNDVQHGYEDFRLMMLCRHHIICRSSFSWWAALLADQPGKIVIHPGAAPSPDEWTLLGGYC